MDEICDIYTSNGVYSGKKTIQDIHSDGNWHKSIHVWGFVNATHGMDAILSVRKKSKSLYPGQVDCLVSGHYQEGEVLKDIHREPLEEIGIGLQIDDVVFAGLRTVNMPNNKEMQYIFLLDLHESMLQNITAIEPDCIIRVKCADIFRLHKLEADSIDYTCITGVCTLGKRIEIKDFIEQDLEYYHRICESYLLHCSGRDQLAYALPTSLVDILELDRAPLTDKFFSSDSVVIDEYIKKQLSSPEGAYQLHKAISVLEYTSRTIALLLGQNIENLGEQSVFNRIMFLGWLDSEYSNEILFRLTKSQNPAVRAFSLFIYAEVIGERAIEVLSDGLNDSNDYVIKHICFSLGWNQGRKRKKMLSDALKNSRPSQTAIIHYAIDKF